MNYFEFLEALKVGDEVLTSTTGDRIFKVIRCNEFLIMLNNGGMLFDRETGEILPKKEHNTRSLVELTDERRKAIEEREKEEAEKRRVWKEYRELTGRGYSYKAPSVEIQKEVIKLIEKMNTEKG